MNWYGTLKRLKKDYTPGTLGQELGIGVQNNILDVARGWPTKKKPSAVYADAVNTQVQAVDKKHTLQRFSKKLLSEVGASSSVKAEAAAPVGSPGSPGLTSPGSVAAPAARRVTLDPTAGTPASVGGASSRSATAEIFQGPQRVGAGQSAAELLAEQSSPKRVVLRGGGAAVAAAAATPRVIAVPIHHYEVTGSTPAKPPQSVIKPEKPGRAASAVKALEAAVAAKEAYAATKINAAAKGFVAKKRYARAKKLTVDELASPAGPPNPSVTPASVRVRQVRQVPYSPRRAPRKAATPGAPRVGKRLAPMRIRGKELRYDVVKTPRKPRKGRREDQLESSGGQNLIQLFESEVVAPAPPKRKSLGVGPHNAARLRRQPLSEEQQQAMKAGRAATKIQKIVRGRAVRKALKPVAVPVVEPVVEPVPEAPVQVAAPKRKSLGVGPGNAGRLRRQPVSEEQQQIIKAGRAATKIQKIVRGAAARKQVQALRMPVAEPAQSPVRAAPVAQSPSRTALEALAPGELKAHYTRITGNKGKVGRDKMLAAIARAKGW